MSSKTVEVKYRQGGKIFIIKGNENMSLNETQAIFIAKTIAKLLDPPLFHESKTAGDQDEKQWDS